MDKIENLGQRFLLNGLPDELLAEIIGTPERETEIIECLKELDGIATINEVLVMLYRKFNKIKKRAYIVNLLYRMQKANLICSVKGKKGVYTLPNLNHNGEQNG